MCDIIEGMVVVTEKVITDFFFLYLRYSANSVSLVIL